MILIQSVAHLHCTNRTIVLESTLAVILVVLCAECRIRNAGCNNNIPDR